MGKSLDRLKELAAGNTSSWLEEANWYRQNSGWLKRSSKIAFRILSELDNKGMSQKDLALRMDVSPQYVSKIVKGKENLSLETIWKIEEALGITLISVCRDVQYVYPEAITYNQSYAQIPLSERLSTTLNDDYVTYKNTSQNKDDAA